MTPRGLDIVVNHLRQFDAYPPNDAMIARLRAALAAGRRIFAGDANFYLHEAAEATKMGKGMPYPEAHKAVLLKYNLHDFAVYADEVVIDMSEWFNRNWRDYRK